MGEKVTLSVYDITEDSFITIDDTIHLESPYDRSNITNSTVSYVTNIGNDISINAYDLKNNTKKILRLSSENKVVNKHVNEDYFIWTDSYGHSKIYVYDIKNDSQFYIRTNNLFSVNLYSHYCLVNEGANIYCYDLMTKEKIPLTNVSGIIKCSKNGH